MPTTISSVALSNVYNARPFRASNGNHYIVLLNGSGELEVYMADNGVGSWSVQDTANNPAENNINCIAAVLDGTTIHITTTDNATTCTTFYHTFSTSTNTWGTKDQAVHSTASTQLPSGTQTSCDLVVRSDGTVVCVYPNAGASIMGTGYSRVAYRIRSGGTWGSAVAVDDAGSVNYKYSRCVLGASDKVHITYQDSVSHRQHKSLTSGGSLSAAEALSDNFVTSNDVSEAGMVYYDSGGSEIVYGSWVRSTDADVYTAKVTNDGTPAAEARASDSSFDITIKSSASLAVDTANDTVYLVYVDGSSRDIYMAKDSGSGWGTHTEILDAVTVSTIGANIYTIDSTDIVLGYVYDDGGTIKYNEYVVVVGSVVRSIIGTADDNVIATSTLNIIHSRGATIDDNITATSTLNIVHSRGATADDGVLGNSALDVAWNISGTVDDNITASSALNIGHSVGATLNDGITGTSALSVDHTQGSTYDDGTLATSNLTVNHSVGATSDDGILAVSDLSLSLNIAGTVADNVVATSELSVGHSPTGDLADGIVNQSALAIQHDTAATFDDGVLATSSLEIGRVITGAADDGIVGSSALQIDHNSGAALADNLIGQSALDITHSQGASVDDGITSSSDLSITHNTGAVHSDGIVGQSDLVVTHTTGFVADDNVVANTALDIIHNQSADFADNVSANSSLAIDHVTNAVFDDGILAQSNLSVLLLNEIAGIADDGIDADSALSVDHVAEASFSDGVTIESNLFIAHSITATFDDGIVGQSDLTVQSLNDIAGIAADGILGNSNVSIEHTTGADISDGIQPATTLAIIHSNGALLEDGIYGESSLSIVYAPSGNFADGITGTSELTVIEGARLISGIADDRLAATTILTIEHDTPAILTDGMRVTSTLTVINPPVIAHYVGELGRYRLYDGVFADDYALYEGAFTGNWQLYQGEFDEDYSLYAGELATYKRYIGSLVFLNEEGIVIEKAILGAVIAPKFTLTAGADHGGTFAEPDTVTIKVKWGDDTEETYSTDDVDNPVVLDPDNEGVYYATLVPTVEGTAKVYALAEWETPVWAVAMNKRVEVVGIYETQ